ncbi:FAD-dependent oxidoreductase [Actinocorallia sp. B10E7]|uniref:FAD-dependent oxidoreductase n=1 Tax=Actinocorallia sp. B10E7 TaxID=3153558 RepID=UPI00325D282B
MEKTTCAIAGGGPAGLMLGLLLARAGVEVVVLEKHGDFLRDFRGDTVHPSTLEILDELGLGPRFAELPQRRAERMTAVTDEETVVVADLALLRGRHRYIAFVPQWDFLDLLAEEARGYPNFRLRMNCEVLGFTGSGLRYRDENGEERVLEALLSVAADGRGSVLRRGLPLREFGAPMDVGWFRLPRSPSDRTGPFLRVGGGGRLMVAIDRDAYWQMGYVVPKGRPVGDPETVGASVAELAPWLADRVSQMGPISTLRVQVNRLERWYRPGLLCIGDAAHAMSPVFGIGINLAVQDAVAAANLLWEPLRRGRVTLRDLAAVQRRRAPVTRVVQRFQVLAQRRLIAPALAGKSPIAPLKALSALSRVPPIGRLVVTLLAHGVRPEHVRVPEARRPPERSGAG